MMKRHLDATSSIRRPHFQEMQVGYAGFMRMGNYGAKQLDHGLARYSWMYRDR